MKGRRSGADQCLGEQAAALTDGELGPEARDNALAHLVRCDGCRDEVAGQRRLKARLGELSDPVLPTGLLDRLTAIGSLDAPELSLGPDTWDGQPVGQRVGGARHRVRLHGLSRRPRVDPHRRGVRYVITGGVSVLALGVSAFALGGGQSTPTVVPAVDSFAVEHASTADEVPFGVAQQSVPFRPVLVSTQQPAGTRQPVGSKQLVGAKQ